MTRRGPIPPAPAVDTAWRDEAACRDADPDIFFPPGRDHVDRPSTARARAICAGCPVLDDCLAHAIATDQPDGIWGGLNTTERRRLARSRHHAGGAAS